MAARPWSKDMNEAMSQLAAMFPSLLGAPGSAPWNQDNLLAWLCTAGLSHGELLAARFVLSVWNSSTDWEQMARDAGLPFPAHARRFDYFEAMATWDNDHRAALLAWTQAPFWP